ncbi:MAG TPA: hypothetical protein VHE81_21790, partial [Lacipirellulaceae bacterium]|nr:hypothetical protein [Lacipirellulaceae bacterium]
MSDKSLEAHDDPLGDVPGVVALFVLSLLILMLAGGKMLTPETRRTEGDSRLLAAPANPADQVAPEFRSLVFGDSRQEHGPGNGRGMGWPLVHAPAPGRIGQPLPPADEFIRKIRAAEA